MLSYQFSPLSELVYWDIAKWNHHMRDSRDGWGPVMPLHTKVKCARHQQWYQYPGPMSTHILKVVNNGIKKNLLKKKCSNVDNVNNIFWMVTFILDTLLYFVINFWPVISTSISIIVSLQFVNCCQCMFVDSSFQLSLEKITTWREIRQVCRLSNVTA